MMRRRHDRPLLPFIEITWDEVADDTNFVRYNVLRREAGEDAWTRITYFEDSETVRYRDYTARSFTEYQYTVTQTTAEDDIEIDSEPAEIIAARVEFEWAYLHEVHHPENFCVLYSTDVRVQGEQDVEFLQGWGRRAPTAFFGERDSVVISIDTIPEMYRGGLLWPSLRALITRQVTAGAALCLRLGVAGERYFVAAHNNDRGGSARNYEVGVTLTETHFTEEV